MKKILKKIIPILILCIFAFSLSVMAAKDPEIRQYKNRTINILGFEVGVYDKEYFNGENTLVTDEEKERNNMIVGGFCAFLVIYWIALLVIFEREDPYYYSHQDSGDIETLKKYNPMLAGCLVDNRDVCARDVIAVIMNLVQKQAINMKMIPTQEGKDTYRYMISENKESNPNLDEAERYVLNWIFGFYEQEEIDLAEKLKEISKRKDFSKHLKELNKITQAKLNKMGANINKVPFFLKVINVFLIVISVIIAIVHIANNGLDVHIYESTILLMMLIVAGVIFILPIIVFVIHIILLLTAIIKKAVKDQIDIHSGKQIVSTSVLILISMFVVMFLIYIIVPNKSICLDIFMIGMAILIVRTDNLMTKHNPEMLHDYYELQRVRDKISEYSLMEEKEINDIKLWEEYLIYAIAFGIPMQIIEKLKEKYTEDRDIRFLLEADSLYHICKAYLEVMWDMNFEEKKEKKISSNIYKDMFKMNLKNI